MAKLNKKIEFQFLTQKRNKIRSLRAKLSRKLGKLNIRISELAKELGFPENS